MLDQSSQNNRSATPPTKLALRPREASKALGIGERLLWQLTADGRIPYIKVGRCTLYPVRELQDWLTERAGTEIETNEQKRGHKA